MNKSELRSLYLKKRRELEFNDIRERSEQIADRFFNEFEVERFSTTHCFISIPRLSEIDTSLVYERVWIRYPQNRVVAPRMNPATGEIDSVLFERDSKLVENSWGIREPAGESIIDPGEIDAVLVPVLSYDMLGNRIGYGKGFYDKFLARCRPDCRRIGLNFFGPVDRIDDVNEYDIRLEYCLTPEVTYSFPPV
jgi:5-formyltetrahydrofolate cyclo-ligase